MNESMITNITDQTGSDYWKSQYVFGNYEIKDLEETGVLML